MKTRNGFVSNSSSSSFVVRKAKLSSEQISQILKPVAPAKKFKLDYPDDAECWHIKDVGEFIEGYTSMDNFRMDDLFVVLEIPITEYAIDRDYNGKGPGKLKL